MTKYWGADAQAVRGALFYPHELPGFVAEEGETVVGVATYRRLDPINCELTTLNSLQAGVGIGGALVRAVVDAAKMLGCTRLLVVTTNDNLRALGFYQRRGFVLHEVRIDAVTIARRTLKAVIPLVADNGIPIRDEIELAVDINSEEQS